MSDTTLASIGEHPSRTIVPEVLTERSKRALAILKQVSDQTPASLRLVQGAVIGEGGMGVVRATFAALTVLLASCNAVFGIDETTSLNFNPRTLVFDNGASTTDLVDFPVPVTLDSSRIGYEDVADPRTDLRFESGGVDLPFEIERWDPAGESTVWVRVPRITAGSTTDRMLMYYGPDAHGSEQPAAVWQGYDLVVHADHDFASSNGMYPPSPQSVTLGPGKLAGAAHFAGTGGIRFGGSQPLLDGWPQYTVEMWLYADYATSNLTTEPGILDNGGQNSGSFVGGRLFPVASVDFLLKIQIDLHFADGYISYQSAYVPLRQWVHIIYTYDGQTAWVYRNGAFSDLDHLAQPTPLDATTEPFILGRVNGGTSLTGILDEIRVSRVYRSPDWIDAQYRAMTGKFITFRSPGGLP